MARSKKNELKDKAVNFLRSAITDNGELVENHRAGLAAYMQEPLGTEVEGRSQVVMSDVSDTVEWMMPSLMKIFYGGHQVVTISPQGPEDEMKAKLMEEKVNFDFQKGMNGYLVMHDWFKDALLGKLGVVKYWWEKGTTVKNVNYAGLTMDEIDTLTDIEFDEIIDNEDGTYDIEGKRVTEYSKPMCMTIPPEEFICDVTASDSMQSARFSAHKKKVHKTYLKKYGIKPKDVEGQRDAFENETLSDERFSDLGGVSFIHDSRDDDFVYLYECYLDDYDDDGNAIPMKLVIFGEKVLSMEENTYGRPPFCAISSIRIPHRLAGRSIADLVIEIQELKTAVVRAILDNIYYQNNGVTVVNPYRINMDDVIDRNEPGAKWRTQYDVDPSSVFAPVPVHPISPQAFQLIEQIDQIKEKRTGITSYNQGLDSKSLNKTATGISQIMGASQQRMELIARMFAETGVRELFQAFVDMNLDYFDKTQSIKVGDGWAELKPQDIDGKFDVVLEVGVGTGSQEIKINQMTNMLNMTAPLLQGGVVTPENMQNLLKEIYLLMGHKNTDKFVGGPQQGPDPQVQQQMQQMQQVIQQLQEKLKEAESKKEIEMAKLKQKDAKDVADLQLREREFREEVRLKDEDQDIREKGLILQYTQPEKGQNDKGTKEGA